MGEVLLEGAKEEKTSIQSYLEILALGWAKKHESRKKRRKERKANSKKKKEKATKRRKEVNKNNSSPAKKEFTSNMPSSAQTEVQAVATKKEALQQMPSGEVDVLNTSSSSSFLLSEGNTSLQNSLSSHQTLPDSSSFPQYFLDSGDWSSSPVQESPGLTAANLQFEHYHLTDSQFCNIPRGQYIQQLLTTASSNVPVRTMNHYYHNSCSFNNTKTFTDDVHELSSEMVHQSLNNNNNTSHPGLTVSYHNNAQPFTTTYNDYPTQQQEQQEFFAAQTSASHFQQVDQFSADWAQLQGQYQDVTPSDLAAFIQATFEQETDLEDFLV